MFDDHSTMDKLDGFDSQASRMRRAQIVYALRAYLGNVGRQVGTNDIWEFVQEVIRRDATMDTFGTRTDGFAYSSGSSLVLGVSGVVSVTETGTTNTSVLAPGDPATIARGIFRDEVRDVLIVLNNCGALCTADERRWCVEELRRLLLALCFDDLA